MASIIMCLTQQEVKKPYTFKKTGVNVYSLEEALYYTYTNWQQNDFVSPAFERWVEGVLRLPDIATKIKEAVSLEDYSQRLFAFLSVTPYIDPTKIDKMKPSVQEWEQNNTGAHLKEEGDMHLNDSPALATELYKKALAKEEDPQTYNNLAISYMYTNMYDKALEAFYKAYNLDKDNLDILFNYSLSLVETGDADLAFKYIRKAKSINKENSYVYFLYGKAYYKTRNINKAIENYEKAIGMEDSIAEKSEYSYALAKAYMTARRYSEAKETIEQIKEKDYTYYTSLAEISERSEDYPGAIKAMQKVLELGYKNPNTLAKLASYHRQNYDLDSAKSAIDTALHLNASNKLAILEDAKIKKAAGKLRDYQKTMERILTEAKDNYRESVG